MVKQLRTSTWNWLPAFLEIAETGSVAEASRQLHLTPAAVSRTLRLLEQELGEPLFNRVGRSLVLNSRGTALRDAVRTSVTAIDRGLTESLADPFAGVLRVASLGVLTEHFVVPCLVDLKREHSEFLPEHLNLRTAEAVDELARGQLDVAFYYEEISAPDVAVERIGTTPMSVYCGRAHPLFSRPRVTQRMVLEYPFSVPQIGDSGRVMDGWPTDLARRVGMRITTLQSNLVVCRSGALLTVLPDVTAAESVADGELRRLPVRGLPDIPVFTGRPTFETVRTRLAETNRALRAARPGTS